MGVLVQRDLAALSGEVPGYGHLRRELDFDVEGSSVSLECRQLPSRALGRQEKTDDSMSLRGNVVWTMGSTRLD